jgi:hypothetical protein
MGVEILSFTPYMYVLYRGRIYEYGLLKVYTSLCVKEECIFMFIFTFLFLRSILRHTRIEYEIVNS